MAGRARRSQSRSQSRYPGRHRELATPAFELELGPQPAPRPTAAAPAVAPPPALDRRAAKFLTRVSAAVEDRDLLVAWPARVIELAAYVEAVLRAHPDADPQRQAARVVCAISLCNRGQPFRLPAAPEIERVLRDAELYRAFDGRNARELARRYGLELVVVYRIIRRQRVLRQRQLAARRIGANAP